MLFGWIIKSGQQYICKEKQEKQFNILIAFQAKQLKVTSFIKYWRAPTVLIMCQQLGTVAKLTRPNFDWQPQPCHYVIMLQSYDRGLLS